jgi:hypothetical protein
MTGLYPCGEDRGALYSGVIFGGAFLFKLSRRDLLQMVISFEHAHAAIARLASSRKNYCGATFSCCWASGCCVVGAACAVAGTFAAHAILYEMDSFSAREILADCPSIVGLTHDAFALGDQIFFVSPVSSRGGGLRTPQPTSIDKVIKALPSANIRYSRKHSDEFRLSTCAGLRKDRLSLDTYGVLADAVDFSDLFERITVR